MPYGNPILSPYVDPNILTGKHGQFQVRALPDADTFGLFYLANPTDDMPRGWTLLACHPNGHSCKELANRILATWAGKGDGARAIDQSSAKNFRTWTKANYARPCCGSRSRSDAAA